MIDFTDLQPTDSDGHHLTATQVVTIEAYLVDLLYALDLGHWRVYVAKDLPPPDTTAMIDPTDGRRVAMLYLNTNWWQRNAEDKRRDLTHECLHLAHHDTDAGIRRFFDDTGDVASYVTHLVMGEFKTNLERMVDLSYVLAPHLPPWPVT